jgi:hypothetical protein
MANPWLAQDTFNIVRVLRTNYFTFLDKRLASWAGELKLLVQAQ